MTNPSAIKFLLVDDLEANLLALEGLLRRDGLELLRAHSGPEALELLLVHDVALAFLDVQMPGMGGFELAETMRSIERTRRVPIIFLTAGVVDQQRRIRGYETGAVDFLAKPIEASDLLNKAATFFELARQRQELRESEIRLQIANEQLAQADRRKDEFLAMLAHELRNPLAPLRNAAEILQITTVSAEERSQAHRILARQIENMSRMIDDLLDVSRITEGKIELRQETVGLEPILTAATSLMQSSCAARRQVLTVSLPASPVFLNADATRLEQVFINLLGNACKYGGEGCHIWLSAERASAASEEVVVRVRDDGAGIEPDLLPRIFDLFVQASRTLDRTHGGLCIGLTLVKRLVQLHGGTVEAHSAGLGTGSEFVVRLPMLRHAPSLPPPALPSPEGAPRRILIVDDNTDSARSMATLQNRRGHETRTAFSGPEALAVAADFQPEVVLLDIGLPGMDGYEAARQLRSMPTMKTAFLVAMTGYGGSEDRAQARNAGFDEFLVKPIDLSVLRAWLRDRPQASLHTVLHPV